MSAPTNNSTWDALKEFGFAADDDVMSDIMPGLSFDFGNFKLSASAVMGRFLQPIVLFTGVIATPRTVTEVLFEILRSPMPRELVAAHIVWNLDRVSPDRRFVPTLEVNWLEMGRQNQHLLPWEIYRAERAKEEAAYAARPHCIVNRSVLRLAINSLKANLEEADAPEPVTVDFDGRVLSFLCQRVETVLGATGNAWPSRIRVHAKRLRDNLPRRLKYLAVEVGIWNSALEIGHTRFRGVEEMKLSGHHSAH
jgi:hypothetical protein